MSIFPDVVRDLTYGHTDIPEVNKRFAKLLQYNVPKGKKYRGLLVVAAYKMMESHEHLTPDNIRLANILGWCIEMVSLLLSFQLHSSFLIINDITDGSETRRGLPCWYKNEHVGLQAVGDALMIRCGLYSILTKHFSDRVCYLPLVESFNDVNIKAMIGQSLNNMSYVDGRPKLDCFTMNRYNAIVKYRTAYYSLQLPIALSMYLAGIYDHEMHRQAKTISLEVAHFLQVL
ncbi:hypothetical protein ILUMI_20092, partial [Ignelater luminosus]